MFIQEFWKFQFGTFLTIIITIIAIAIIITIAHLHLILSCPFCELGCALLLPVALLAIRMIFSYVGI